MLTLFSFFAIDKKLQEVYIFSTKGYSLMTMHKLGAPIQTVYNELGREDYLQRDTKEIYGSLFERVLISEIHVAQVNGYDGYIPFTNGLYNVATKALEPYDPRFYYTSSLHVESVDSKVCPEFRKFMDRIIPRFEDQMRIFSFFCYAMTPSVKYQIAQVWIGTGQNGKTELTSLFDMIMPELVSHISMDQFMDGHKFLESELAQKWLNIGSELSPSNFKDTGVQKLKRNITNKYQRMEGKYDSAVNFLNKCKQLYDINSTPAPNAYTDYAFFRRFQLIVFGEHIEDDEIELEIMKRIFAQEGPQIVQFFLSFYDQMGDWLKRDADEAERLWAWNTNSVFVFYTEHCTPNGIILTEMAYEKYTLFCKHNDKQAVSRNQFGRLLRSRRVERVRINQEQSIELLGDYDPKNRGYVYLMDVEYEEADDILRMTERVKEKVAFLKASPYTEVEMIK